MENKSYIRLPRIMKIDKAHLMILFEMLLWFFFHFPLFYFQQHFQLIEILYSPKIPLDYINLSFLPVCIPDGCFSTEFPKSIS